MGSAKGLEWSTRVLRTVGRFKVIEGSSSFLFRAPRLPLPPCTSLLPRPLQEATLPLCSTPPIHLPVRKKNKRKKKKPEDCPFLPSLGLSYPIPEDQEFLQDYLRGQAASCRCREPPHLFPAVSGQAGPTAGYR